MMSTEDEVVREEALRRVMTHLLSENWAKTSPELGTNVHRIVKRVTGNKDPYERLKEKYNKMALKLYPRLESAVKKSRDPFLAATKVSIAGNAIDFGPSVEINLRRAVNNSLESELVIKDIDQFKKSTQKYRNALFLADNAGETFFDKILIKELAKRDVDVTYVVKGAPILNDATLRDAEMAKIDDLATVVTTGTDCMGVLFKECSKDFLKIFKKSNLVISKGQGNYESLSDVKNKEIFFLLKAKCSIIAEDLMVKTGSMVLKRLLKTPRAVPY